MKKFLITLTALVLSASALCSCSINPSGDKNSGSETKASEKTSKRSDKEAAENAVDDFLSAVVSLDFDKAKRFTSDTDAIDELEEDLEDVFLSEFGELEDFISEDAFIDMLTIPFSRLSYTIDKVSVDGDTAEAEVSLISPDFDAMEDLSDSEMSRIAQYCFGFDFTDEDEILEAYLDRKGMTLDEFIEQNPDITEDDIVADVFAEFSSEIDDFLVEIVRKTLENVDDTEETIYVTLEKQSDNTWLVSEYDDIL